MSGCIRGYRGEGEHRIRFDETTSMVLLKVPPLPQLGIIQGSLLSWMLSPGETTVKDGPGNWTSSGSALSCGINSISEKDVLCAPG